MIAIDTNVLVRLILADDPRQLAIAEALLAREEIYVSLTVLLETEWVLRSRYRFDRRACTNALANFLALPAIAVERRPFVEWALGRYALGGDFADLIHLAAVPEGVRAFASFDKGLTTSAGNDAPVAITQLETS